MKEARQARRVPDAPQGTLDPTAGSGGSTGATLRATGFGLEVSRRASRVRQNAFCFLSGRGHGPRSPAPGTRVGGRGWHFTLRPGYLVRDYGTSFPCLFFCFSSRPWPLVLPELFLVWPGLLTLRASQMKPVEHHRRFRYWCVMHVIVLLFLTHF